MSAVGDFSVAAHLVRVRARGRAAIALATAVYLVSAVSCKKQTTDTPAASSTASVSPVPTPVTPPATSASPVSPVPALPSAPATPGTPASAGDTVRGTVQRVGNDPVSVLVLKTGGNNGTMTFALRGSQRALLERVTGLEIVVTGTLTAERDMQAAPRGAPVFDVRQFEVRASDGVAAVDGVVNVQDGKYSLVTPSGQRLNAPHLPAELRNQVGARVFLVGPLQQTATAYGIISPKT